MASYRHLARVAVMQAIFAHELRGGNADSFLKYNLQEFSDKLKDVTFAKELLHGLLEKKEDILLIIQEEATEWPLEKIAPIDRAILQLGTYEILYSKDVPPIVAINESVEIAKAYGDTNSAKFINGVLSTVMHKYGKESQKLKVKSQNTVKSPNKVKSSSSVKMPGKAKSKKN